jgi:cyclopropane-fatty-acyl-phospholipid synthase
MLNLLIDMTERGLIPDTLVRMGIRKLCQVRLKEMTYLKETEPSLENRYAEMLKNSPLAVDTKKANEQHYEVPADFFLKVLGPNRKYSCAFWPEGCTSLAEAEEISLNQTMDRAEIRDGMKILELGCGWGSLTLAMAKKYPRAQITAISNSKTQKQYIDNFTTSLNIRNVNVLTHDVSVMENIGDDTPSFDRVISIEMFEHFRNYEILLKRISQWLKPDGKLFVHIFTHKQYPYLFETQGDDNWMGRYFFTGGQMPSHSLLNSFQHDLKIQKEWTWSGIHYQKTSEAWLKNMREHQVEIIKILEGVYGAEQASRWFNRWRVFFLSVAELFGYKNGTEWGVSHYLFTKRTH